MLGKLARLAFILLLLGAGTAVAVADHVLIGAAVFIGMIVMVATGPRPGHERELSDMEKARRKAEEN